MQSRTALEIGEWAAAFPEQLGPENSDFNILWSLPRRRDSRLVSSHEEVFAAENHLQTRTTTPAPPARRLAPPARLGPSQPTAGRRERVARLGPRAPPLSLPPGAWARMSPGCASSGTTTSNVSPSAPCSARPARPRLLRRYPPRRARLPRPPPAPPGASPAGLSASRIALGERQPRTIEVSASVGQRRRVSLEDGLEVGLQLGGAVALLARRHPEEVLRAAAAWPPASCTASAAA